MTEAMFQYAREQVRGLDEQQFRTPLHYSGDLLGAHIPDEAISAAANYVHALNSRNEGGVRAACSESGCDLPPRYEWGDGQLLCEVHYQARFTTIAVSRYDLFRAFLHRHARVVDLVAMIMSVIASALAIIAIILATSCAKREKPIAEDPTWDAYERAQRESQTTAVTSEEYDAWRTRTTANIPTNGKSSSAPSRETGTSTQPHDASRAESFAATDTRASSRSTSPLRLGSFPQRTVRSASASPMAATPSSSSPTSSADILRPAETRTVARARFRATAPRVARVDDHAPMTVENITYARPAYTFVAVQIADELRAVNWCVQMDRLRRSPISGAYYPTGGTCFWPQTYGRGTWLVVPFAMGGGQPDLSVTFRYPDEAAHPIIAQTRIADLPTMKASDIR